MNSREEHSVILPDAVLFSVRPRALCRTSECPVLWGRFTMSILTSTDWVRYESRPGGAFIKSSVTGSKAPVATVFVLGDTFMVAPYLSLSPGPVGGGGGVTAADLTASWVVFRCLSAGPYDGALGSPLRRCRFWRTRVSVPASTACLPHESWTHRCGHLSLSPRP